MEKGVGNVNSQKHQGITYPNSHITPAKKPTESMIDAATPEETDRILDGIPDPTGQVFSGVHSQNKHGGLEGEIMYVSHVRQAIKSRRMT
jgi:hypothetical protein